MDLPENSRAGLLAEVAPGDNSPPLTVTETGSSHWKRCSPPVGRSYQNSVWERYASPPTSATAMPVGTTARRSPSWLVSLLLTTATFEIISRSSVC